MKKTYCRIVATLTVLTLALLMAGCSQPVPPAYMGKLLTPSGYTPEVYEPGRVTVLGRDKLILLETGTQSFPEQVTVQLADRVRLTFDVQIRTRISGDRSTINAMFSDIVPENNRVTLNQVYRVYGRDVVRNTARQVMNKYTVEDVSMNLERINTELRAAMIENFQGLPLEISNATLGSIEWPTEVTEAINAAAQANAAIATTEANRRRDVAAAQADEAIALARRSAQLVEAQTIRDYNRIIGEGISENFLRYKALQLQEEIAKNGQGQGNSTVFLPYDALGTIGAQNRMFSN